MAIFHDMIMLLFLWPALALGIDSPDVSSNDEHYPPMWERVPESINYFSIQNGQTIIKPWDYLERMSIYKILLTATAKYLNTKEQGNKGNLLWGLPLQLGWQFHTGRLQDTSGPPSSGQNNQEQTKISPKSWWACMNYYLAVIPFFAAVDAGLFQGFPYEIVTSPPDNFPLDFCNSVKECRLSTPKAMDEWKFFFQFIMTFNQVSDSPIPPLSQEDKALSSMWKAHVASINFALPRCSERLQHLSEPERNFGIDWATIVDCIAATNFNTNFESTVAFQTFLPNRPLVTGDKAPYIPDFSKQQNRVLFILHYLQQFNKYSGGLMLRVWRRAMCSEKGRAEGRNLLYNMVHDSKMAGQNMLKIILQMPSSCD